jgi:hypothetical protein
VDSNLASESSPRAAARTRRRFSRTLSRARWPEYGRLLKAALGAGYQVVTLEDFLDGVFTSETAPVLILRHDVDQYGPAALTMSDYEVALGLRSTWYFRWETVDEALIAELRRRGGEIGLHYETLTRAALDGDPYDLADGARIEEARDRLCEEVETCRASFGPPRSVAAHGDTRVPGVRNAELLRERDPAEFGVDYDANFAMRRHRLAVWLTDRSSAEGRWSEGLDPHALIWERRSPILCLTHPNNWVAGTTLWWERFATRAIRHTAEEPEAP